MMVNDLMEFNERCKIQRWQSNPLNKYKIKFCNNFNVVKKSQM